jgi:hypothetical protein
MTPLARSSAIAGAAGAPPRHRLAVHPSWVDLTAAVTELRVLQVQDGSIPGSDTAGPVAQGTAVALVARIVKALAELAVELPHDADYLRTCAADFRRWAGSGFGVPDFHDSLVSFAPQQSRIDGLLHVIVFPMYTQNGSSDRRVEAVLTEVIWPEFLAALETGDFSNALFVPVRFVDFTAGYDTNSAVLFPETVAMRQVPPFTWGMIFADREAARFRRVVRAAAGITRLDLPEAAERMMADQHLTEQAFVMWDLIHDRTHMRGDLPFDPFMIKQRMPFFLYSLEELRCDLTAFVEAVRLARAEDTDPITRERAQLVQYAVIFDRIFRFALTGSRVRNYDGVGGQLLFAWLHQHRVLHWTDTRLTIDWDEVPDVVIALSDAIGDLYWRSIDRPKVAHWLAAYDLVSSTLTPHPASRWAVRGLPHTAFPFSGAPRELTDAVLDDEFPLSMFYEALQKKLGPVIESTAGITARD